MACALLAMWQPARRILWRETELQWSATVRTMPGEAVRQTRIDQLFRPTVPVLHIGQYHTSKWYILHTMVMISKQLENLFSSKSSLIYRFVFSTTLELDPGIITFLQWYFLLKNWIGLINTNFTTVFDLSFIYICFQQLLAFTVILRFHPYKNLFYAAEKKKKFHPTQRTDRCWSAASQAIVKKMNYTSSLISSVSEKDEDFYTKFTQSGAKSKKHPAIAHPVQLLLRRDVREVQAVRKALEAEIITLYSTVHM